MSIWIKVAECHSLTEPDKKYDLKVNAYGHYGCSCMSWRFCKTQHRDELGRAYRTCKHTELMGQVLGRTLTLVKWSGGEMYAEIDGTKYVLRKWNGEVL